MRIVLFGQAGFGKDVFEALRAAGEEIVIGKAGKPVARLVPYKEPPPQRKPGSMKGKIRIARDFNDLPDDVLAAFKGERP